MNTNIIRNSSSHLIDTAEASKASAKSGVVKHKKHKKMTTNKNAKPRKASLSVKKQPWSKEEDSRLQQLVANDVTFLEKRNWAELAGKMDGRTGKQCRERWQNHLRPNIKKGDWTDEEDTVIVKLQSKIGNSWTAIAKALPHRTDNDIKNRWHSRMRSKTKREKRLKSISAIKGQAQKKKKLSSFVHAEGTNTPTSLSGICVPPRTLKPGQVENKAISSGSPTDIQTPLFDSTEIDATALQVLDPNLLFAPQCEQDDITSIPGGSPSDFSAYGSSTTPHSGTHSLRLAGLTPYLKTSAV